MEKILYLGTTPEYSARGIVTPSGIFCKVSLTDRGVLSISGVIGPLPSGNARGSCGQIDSTLREKLAANEITPAPEWTRESLAAFLDVWDRWHLNDLRAACEHQRAAGWEKLAAEMITSFQWQLTSKTRDEKRELEKLAIEAARNGKAFDISNESRRILGLENYIMTETDALPADLAPYYEPTKDSTGSGYFAHVKTQRRGHEYPANHSKGLLGKTCDVCGYKYGTAWLFEKLPPEVIRYLESLPAASKTPAWV